MALASCLILSLFHLVLPYLKPSSQKARGAKKLNSSAPHGSMEDQVRSWPFQIFENDIAFVRCTSKLYRTPPFGYAPGYRKGFYITEGLPWIKGVKMKWLCLMRIWFYPHRDYFVYFKEKIITIYSIFNKHTFSKLLYLLNQYTQHFTI